MILHVAGVVVASPDVSATAAAWHRLAVALPVDVVPLGDGGRAGLVEVALEAGADAGHLIDFAHQIDDAWLEGVDTIGISSGASVPAILVQDVLTYLAERGYGDVEEVTTAAETIVFALPRVLRPART